MVGKQVLLLNLGHHNTNFFFFVSGCDADALERTNVAQKPQPPPEPIPALAPARSPSPPPPSQTAELDAALEESDDDNYAAEVNFTKL